MVSRIPTNIKKLGNFLQEEQEPFILDIYLLERSFSKKNMISDGNSSTNGSPDSDLKSKQQVKSRGTCISRCSNLFKTVYNKFVLINIVNSRKNNSLRKDVRSNSSTTARNKQEVVEPNRLSSSSSSTILTSCSESDTEDSWKDNNLSTSDSLDVHFQNNSSENEDNHDKLRSPVSVLDEISSQEWSPLHKTKMDYMARHEQVKEYMLSASLLELLSQSSHNNVQGPQYHFSSVKILQDTKQLLLDCVREILEVDKRKRRRQQLFICKEYLGCEEIGKLICEKLIAWDEQSLNDTLLNCVFDSAIKWNDIEIEEKETAFDIGDWISGDIINEIVIDLI